MTKPEIDVAAGNYALGNFLCEWPPNMGYDEALTALSENTYNDAGNPHVLVWEAFDRYPPDYVIDQIEGLKRQFIQFAEAVLAHDK